jgi:hypothetical protein
MWANTSRKISSGGRRLTTPVISKKEQTRKGVEFQASGNNSGTASISPTKVTPERAR